MKSEKTILFFDTYEEVRHFDEEVIFKTTLDEELQEDLGRRAMNTNVVENVVSIWNETCDIEEVDLYLLDEGRCSQEERELIIEALADFFKEKETKTIIINVQIQMDVKEDQQLEMAVATLNVMNTIIQQSELESQPQIFTEFLSASDIIDAEEEE